MFMQVVLSAAVTSDKRKPASLLVLAKFKSHTPDLWIFNLESGIWNLGFNSHPPLLPHLEEQNVPKLLDILRVTCQVPVTNRHDFFGIEDIVLF